jgi:hypothetical protein
MSFDHRGFLRDATLTVVKESSRVCHFSFGFNLMGEE